MLFDVEVHPRVRLNFHCNECHISRTCTLLTRCRWSVPPEMRPAVVAFACIATEFMTYCVGCCLTRAPLEVEVDVDIGVVAVAVAVAATGCGMANVVA